MNLIFKILINEDVVFRVAIWEERVWGVLQ